MPELRRPAIATFITFHILQDAYLSLTRSTLIYLSLLVDNPWHVSPSVTSPHTVASQEHPKLGVYVKGLYLMPCETKKDVMGSLAIIW